MLLVKSGVSTHEAASDPHGGYRLESADHNHESTGAEAGLLGFAALSQAVLSYNPAITQGGAVSTYTTQIGRYFQLGKLVVAWGHIVVNNAGAAAGANPIQVSLPVAQANTASWVVGNALLFDSSANIMYKGVGQIPNAGNLLQFQPSNDISVDASNFFLGNKVFTAALATGDDLKFFCVYIAA